MSQRNVETLIGRIVTDEAFRRIFSKDPVGALTEVTARGVDLTPPELRALASLDTRLVGMLADTIDPRIQKVDLRGGRT